MNNEDLLKCFVLSGTLNGHLERMKNNRVCGTQVELYAAVTLLTLLIIICLYSKRRHLPYSSAITHPLEKEPVTICTTFQ